jgi:predicted acyl esterase
VDPAASTSYQPVHTFLHPQPLTSDQTVALQIALGPSSTLFHPGDTLRLLISGRSLAPQNADVHPIANT